MNNEQTLAELLQFVRETKDFASEQAPLVAEEILRWRYMDNLMTMIVLICLAFTCYIISFILWKKKELEAAIGVTLLGITFSLITLAPGWDMMKIHTAPRLVIIEHISEMLQ